MEDGNPDKVDNLINLGKRELIYRVIEEVNQYQVTPYQIQASEPIHTFLRELPHLEEKDLFDLSLVREPRRPQN
jgi:son of sevenless-like protein